MADLAPVGPRAGAEAQILSGPAPETRLTESTIVRLETQLDVLSTILADTTPGGLEARPRPGEWSARENLAHLARHHAVFVDRLERILREDRPQLGRYRAEDDPEWEAWSRLPLDQALGRLRESRRRLIERLKSLTPVELGRTGTHPTFGAMTVPRWVEFLLLHEAHHLYIAMIRIGEANRVG